MKYIVIQEVETGSEFAVFCLAPQTHADLARAWRRDESRRVVAAGFCEFIAPVPGETAWGVRVSGSSVSLGGLANRGPKDASLISVMYHGTISMARQDEARRSLAVVSELASPALDQALAP